MSITGKRIQERRKQLGINADVLAEYLGVSRSTIFRYENGAIEKIPANLLSDIAKYRLGQIIRAKYFYIKTEDFVVK